MWPGDEARMTRIGSFGLGTTNPDDSARRGGWLSTVNLVCLAPEPCVDGLPRALSVLTLAALTSGAGVGAAHGADSTTKNVLVLCSERPDLPAVRLVEQSLRDAFGAATSPGVEWFSEYLDFGRFSAAEQEATLGRYLRERYADRRIDLVLPIAGQALAFALRHREELFPGVPIVFAVLRSWRSAERRHSTRR
jgi:hypothetical protein